VLAGSRGSTIPKAMRSNSASPTKARPISLARGAFVNRFFPLLIGSLLSPLLDAPTPFALHDKLKKLGERRTAPTHRGFVAAIS
jgi:hypothetical protein